MLKKTLFLMSGIFLGANIVTFLFYSMSFYEFYDFKTYLIVNSTVCLLCFSVLYLISKKFFECNFFIHKVFVGLIFSAFYLIGEKLYSVVKGTSKMSGVFEFLVLFIFLPIIAFFILVKIDKCFKGNLMKQLESKGDGLS